MPVAVTTASILPAMSEPIESVGSYIPSASVANFMTTPDSQMEVSEPVAVKKVA